MKLFLFTFTHFIILFSMLLTLRQVHGHISHLKHYESKHALAHVIASIRSGRFQQMDDDYEQKCTVNSVCCLCNKNFKNTSLLQLHMSLRHPVVKKTPEEQMLAYVFDKKINSEFRFEMCTKLLAIMDISHLSQIHEALKTPQQKYFNSSIFLSALSKTQTVDACTIITYGAYHQPLWQVWIKGTLIFVFVVVLIVYYASFLDEVSEMYFRKKNKIQKLPQSVSQIY